MVEAAFESIDFIGNVDKVFRVLQTTRYDIIVSYKPIVSILVVCER